MHIDITTYNAAQEGERQQICERLAAEVSCQSLAAINSTDLQRWLQKARTIQWDYKNIVKRRGTLVRLETA